MPSTAGGPEANVKRKNGYVAGLAAIFGLFEANPKRTGKYWVARKALRCVRLERWKFCRFLFSSD
jgi:hypothetical protein